MLMALTHSTITKELAGSNCFHTDETDLSVAFSSHLCLLSVCSVPAVLLVGVHDGSTRTMASVSGVRVVSATVFQALATFHLL